MQLIQDIMKGIKSPQKLNDWIKSQKKEDGGQSLEIQYATSKCEFGKCDGSGVYVEIIDGYEVGKICECMKYRKAETKIKFADIPEEFSSLTINSFDLSLYSDPKERNIAARAKKIAAEYIRDFNTAREKGKGLYLYGYTKGSGKTRLAASIGNALIKHCNVSVKFVTTLGLLNEIKATYNKDYEYSTFQLLDAIKRVDVLILDDIGFEDMERPWVNQEFGHILDSRYRQRKVTMFTSNCTIDELRHDERIISRIRKMSIPVLMPNESVRDRIAKNENEELLEKWLNR